MQDSKKYFEEFAVWALCLLMLLGGTDNLMACKLDDIDNWKSFHTLHLFKGVVMSCIRIKSMRMASKSNLLSKNVKPISDYMKGEDKGQPFSAATMKGYKRGMWLKDICLSMALSKMLNRRFCSFELGEVKASPTKTSDFVFQGLVAGDNKYERAFRVIEVERHRVAMVTFCSFLTNELFKKYNSNKDKDIPLTATLCLMSIVTFLEALQLYLHMTSNWFKVALIRGYVTDLDRAKKGRERGDLVKLSIQVKQAVIDSLIRSKGQLTNGEKSLEDNGIHGLLLWACATSDEMLIHSILVWHVAKTICKHQFDAELAKGGKQIAALSVKDSSATVDITGPSVQGSSAVASSLSQYCAYLIAFGPDLLPGHSFDSESILDQFIKDARKFLPLQGTKKMEQKCEKLLIPIIDDNYDHPVAQGAQLARQLMDIQDMAKRWKVLSEFWAEMMLYIAPCDDGQVRGHLEALARGGEFITHLWALLKHAGVLNRPPTGSEAG
ncbi:hypothetical protein QYE76_027918 [Lolium multiflorum]|uniref:DUF4220 domain-containing protein n=1 Tax=Lolium multiflorum TaxID=4521 RepID=A0AAD8QJZ8_LOLMU|nr:hypothetical protein QYE76_027918 [Lolium multiflorum]